MLLVYDRVAAWLCMASLGFRNFFCQYWEMNTGNLLTHQTPNLQKSFDDIRPSLSKFVVHSPTAR